MFFNKVFLCIALSNLSNTSMLMSKEGVQTACQQAEHLIETSQETGISPFIVSSMIWHESRWLSDSVSKAKACGLTQVLAKYSDYSCEGLKDPKISITEGVASLFFWLDRKKSIYTALKCYNSGYSCSSTSYANTIIAKSKLLKQEYLKVQNNILGDSNE